MTSLRETALSAARRMRASPGFATLGVAERARVDRDMAQIEAALSGGQDPYARSLADEEPLAGRPARPPSPSAASGAPAVAPSPPSSAAIGGRAADALEAVNFPGFVAGLISGVFQAIVDASAQQVREYAALVASLSQSLDSFTRDNVTDDQARDWVLQRYPRDVRPRLAPARADSSPAWLGELGLDGATLETSLLEGPILHAARSRVGEERMQSLAAMVLMGIHRIVVHDGDIRAKLQFHAVGRERTVAEMSTAAANPGAGIAGRSLQSGAAMMVSTVKANAQSESTIKAELMGEVRVSFRSETFPLDRFADSPAIQLLNRHAKWRVDEPPPAAATPAATPAGAPAKSNGEPPR